MECSTLNGFPISFFIPFLFYCQYRRIGWYWYLYIAIWTSLAGIVEKAIFKTILFVRELGLASSNAIGKRADSARYRSGLLGRQTTQRFFRARVMQGDG